MKTFILLAALAIVSCSANSLRRTKREANSDAKSAAESGAKSGPQSGAKSGGVLEVVDCGHDRDCRDTYTMPNNPLYGPKYPQGDDYQYHAPIFHGDDGKRVSFPVHDYDDYDSYDNKGSGSNGGYGLSDEFLHAIGYFPKKPKPKPKFELFVPDGPPNGYGLPKKPSRRQRSRYQMPTVDYGDAGETYQQPRHRYQVEEPSYKPPLPSLSSIYQMQPTYQAVPPSKPPPIQYQSQQPQQQPQQQRYQHQQPSHQHQQPSHPPQQQSYQPQQPSHPPQQQSYQPQQPTHPPQQQSYQPQQPSHQPQQPSHQLQQQSYQPQQPSHQPQQQSYQPQQPSHPPQQQSKPHSQPSYQPSQPRYQPQPHSIPQMNQPIHNHQTTQQSSYNQPHSNVHSQSQSQPQPAIHIQPQPSTSEQEGKAITSIIIQIEHGSSQPQEQVDQAQSSSSYPPQQPQSVHGYRSPVQASYIQPKENNYQPIGSGNSFSQAQQPRNPNTQQSQFNSIVNQMISQQKSNPAHRSSVGLNQQNNMYNHPSQVLDNYPQSQQTVRYNSLSQTNNNHHSSYTRPQLLEAQLQQSNNYNHKQSQQQTTHYNQHQQYQPEAIDYNQLHQQNHQEAIGVMHDNLQSYVQSQQAIGQMNVHNGNSAYSGHSQADYDDYDDDASLAELYARAGKLGNEQGSTNTQQHSGSLYGQQAGASYGQQHTGSSYSQQQNQYDDYDEQERPRVILVKKIVRLSTTTVPGK